MKIIGIWILALASSTWKSRPLTPGNLTSRTRQQAASGRFAAKNSAVDANASTRRPTDRIRLLTAPRNEASSSTRKTTGTALEGSVFMYEPFESSGSLHARQDDVKYRPVWHARRHRQTSAMS